MTLDELRQHELWHTLTRPQQKFTEAYLTFHGDKLKAAKAVWNAKSDAVFIDMANRALRRPAIRKAIALYQGQEIGDLAFPMTKRELSDLLARKLREPRGISTGHLIRLAELFMFLRGWNPAVPTDPPDKSQGTAADDIDDLVLQLERKARKE